MLTCSDNSAAVYRADDSVSACSPNETLFKLADQLGTPFKKDEIKFRCEIGRDAYMYAQCFIALTTFLPLTNVMLFSILCEKQAEACAKFIHY